MCIPFYGPEGHYFTEDEEVIIWELISKILSDPQISKFAQNGMFDFTFLLRTMSILTNNFTFDSMLAHHLCYAELPKGLDALVSYYTTHPYYKDEGKDWRNVSDYTRFWQYNCKDAAYVHELYPTLMNELESYGQLTEFWFLMDLHTPLMEMQYRGIRTDRVGIQQLKEATDKAVVEMQKQLNEMAGKELNPNSSKQLQHYFYVEKKIKPYTNRKTGNWTTDDTALKRLSRRGYEEATLIQSIRKYKKLSSTYLVNRADSDGRLRCSYNIAGTETGRLSSSSTLFGTGTNLQNQPPAIKPYYHADDGYIMLEADEKQAEAVVVAYLAGDEKMIEGFESGVDVHTYNASNIFDVTMDQVMQDQRQLGKKVVHASNYDMGYKTFALQTELPEREAKLLLNAYHSRYPGLRRWHNSIREELTRSRRLLNLFGRHRLFLGMLNDHTFKAAYAFKPQSTVAEVLNRALVKITQADDLYERDFQLLGTVHDSLLNQFPATLDNALYIIPRLEELMTIQLTGKDGREFTIGIDFKIGYNWGRQSEQNPNGMVEIKAADPALIKKAWDDVHNKS
jgi:DNA polymerase-1